MHSPPDLPEAGGAEAGGAEAGGAEAGGAEVGGAEAAAPLAAVPEAAALEPAGDVAPQGALGAPRGLRDVVGGWACDCLGPVAAVIQPLAMVAWEADPRAGSASGARAAAQLEAALSAGIARHGAAERARVALASAAAVTGAGWGGAG